MSNRYLPCFDKYQNIVIFRQSHVKKQPSLSVRSKTFEIGINYTPPRMRHSERLFFSSCSNMAHASYSGKRITQAVEIKKRSALHSRFES